MNIFSEENLNLKNPVGVLCGVFLLLNEMIFLFKITVCVSSADFFLLYLVFLNTLDGLVRYHKVAFCFINGESLEGNTY